ncbi:hypothetical protein [Desulfosporosinus youngiae]|uniref:hypothetical protein n=1 Tax=Desulfosporosinus youngiae TaxID=339862 RepID=UPI0002F70F72|nr:hypothetical protein [Desulfosporosinus youngiae]
MYSKTDQLLGFKPKYISSPDVPYAFLYSLNKLVEKVSAADKDTLFKYDEGSKLKLQTNPNGVEDRFDYNEGNQLIGTSTSNPAPIQKSRTSMSMMTMADLKALLVTVQKIQQQNMFTTMARKS